MRIIDLIWPMLERSQSSIEQQKKHQDSVVDLLGQTTWGKDTEFALSEARNIMKREEERKSATDSKASNLLLVIAAMIPLLTYLEPAVWDGKLGPAPRSPSLILLSLAVVYVLAAAYWALKTLKVAAYHTIDSNELVDIWKNSNQLSKLTNEILKNVARNCQAINHKVSCLKMTYIFLHRGILFFGFVILFHASCFVISKKLPIFLELDFECAHLLRRGEAKGTTTAVGAASCRSENRSAHM